MESEKPAVERLFEAARLLANPGLRANFLQAACGGDLEVLHRVEVLLQAHEHADHFLEQPAAEAATKTLVVTAGMAQVTEKPGERIGRYKLLEQIGEGGYGTVYLAEREEPVLRAALKVIKLGMDTKQVVARFEAERQALALMDHPNIAKVFDAGATETGRPYFVMELVKGIRITDYCDQHRLPTRERLHLFIQICQAVQHAHQKGVIHRDIKPSNILVTLQEGVPVPKIIDFGIAKAIGQRLTDKTLFTARDQFIGTPPYMSPEQAELSGLDIDTRSDIYSLGVLLYELLTGKTPFDAKRLFQAGLDEIRRIIREEEPPRPSTKLSTLAAEEQTTLAKRRQTEPPKLCGLIRGDLDWIALKCLEKDRNRRYETAGNLALDIQRHLNNEPVIAVAPGAFYRFQKFARRRKGTLAAISSFALLLGVATVVSTSQAVRANRASAEARVGRDHAKESLTRYKMQTVEDFFISDPPRALATLASVLREDPANRIAAERLLNGMSYPNSFFVPELPSFSEGAFLVRCSAAGQYIVTATTNAKGSSAQVYDRRGRLVAELPHGKAPIRDLDISPDGTWVVTASTNLVQVWSVSEPIPVATWPSTNGAVRQVILLPREKRFLALAPGCLVLGTLRGSRILHQFNAPAGAFLQLVAVSEEAGLVATADETGAVRVSRLETLELLHTISSAHTNVIRDLEFTSDGLRLISGGADFAARIWNAGTGKRIVELPHDGPVHFATFSPDGQRVLTRSGQKSASLWDASGQCPPLPITHSDALNSARFRPQGDTLVTACADGTAREWGLSDPNPLRLIARFPQSLLDARYTPDGQSVLLLTDQQGVEVRRLTRPVLGQVTNREPRPPVGEVDEKERARLARLHAKRLNFIDISPDRKLVVTASDDRTACVWGREEQNRIGEALTHDAAVNCARFSPDGLRVVTSTIDGVVRLWDTRTSAPLSGPISSSSRVVEVWFSANGRAVVISNFDSVASFAIQAVHARVKPWLPELAEAVAGLRYNSVGLEERVPANQFLKLAKELDRNSDVDPLTEWAKKFVATPATEPTSTNGPPPAGK